MKEVHENLCKFIIPIDAHPNNLGSDKIFQTSYSNLKNILK